METLIGAAVYSVGLGRDDPAARLLTPGTAVVLRICDDALRAAGAAATLALPWSSVIYVETRGTDVPEPQSPTEWGLFKDNSPRRWSVLAVGLDDGREVMFEFDGVLRPELDERLDGLPAGTRRHR